jgi:hypothetical protein
LEFWPLLLAVDWRALRFGFDTASKEWSQFAGQPEFTERHALANQVLEGERITFVLDRCDSQKSIAPSSVPIRRLVGWNLDGTGAFHDNPERSGRF